VVLVLLLQQPLAEDLPLSPNFFQPSVQQIIRLA
jgi:hypothetical protein